MSFDTTDINKERQNLHEYDEIWLFGYGSLIYKVDFPYIQKQVASITGWERRFWQGSHDHRGTPEHPGRVVTLVESDGVVCAGMAFQVTHDVFEHLDHREKNGYLRHEVAIQLHSGDVKTGLIYIADEHNSAYLGEDTELNIAKQIFSSVGPSGKNTDYVLQLTDRLSLEAGKEHLLTLTLDHKRKGVRN